MDNRQWPETDGLPAAEIRLDETLSAPGDVLYYLYDYGDNWELRLRLEEALPIESNCPAAVVIGGSSLGAEIATRRLQRYLLKQ